MSLQQSLWDTPSDTSSPAAESGVLHSVREGGQTTDLVLPDRAHASLSPRRAKELGLLMSGTSGRLSTGTSHSADLARCLVSKLAPMTASLGSTLYRLTWSARTTPLGRSIPALRASARPTSGSDFTGWRSPAASDSERGVHPSPDAKAGMHSLNTEASLTGWPTPKASASGPDTAIWDRDESGGISLPTAAMLAGWPTPMAGTPAKDGNNEAGNTDSSRKTVELAGWQTPGTDSFRSRSGERKEEMGLDQQARSTMEAPGPARLTASGVLLIGSDAVPNLGTQTDGGGQLNPEHSLWLMGIRKEWAYCALRAMQSLALLRKGTSKRASPRSKSLAGTAGKPKTIQGKKVRNAD